VDITEHKQAVQLLAGQNRVLAMIASGASLQETLELLLRVVEAIETDMLCSLLLLDGDGIHVHPIAAPSLPAAYTAALEGAPIGPRAGSCGTAMYRREPVIVTDIQTDPLWEDYRTLALAHGLRSCWSTPIMDATGRVLGAFAIYGLQPGPPEARHERVVRAVTQTAALAIESHRAAEALRQSNQRLQREIVERRAAETEMRTSRGLLQTALKHARMGTWVVEIDKDRLYADDASSILFSNDKSGVPADSARESFRQTVHPDDRERVSEAFEAALRGDSDFDIEFRMRNEEGDWRWIATRALLQRDEEGRPLRLLGASHDVTERRDSEMLIAGQNAVLAMIASGAALQASLDTLMGVVESIGGSGYCAAIMQLDAERQRLYTISAPSLPTAYRAAIEGVAIGPSAGSCGTAVYRQDAVFSQDIATDPLWEGYREAALAAGLRACWRPPGSPRIRRPSPWNTPGQPRSHARPTNRCSVRSSSGASPRRACRTHKYSCRPPSITPAWAPGPWKSTAVFCNSTTP
jgi:GAF domain-containing protein